MDRDENRQIRCNQVAGTYESVQTETGGRGQRYALF